MFDKLTYSKKVFALGLGFAFFLILAYQFSFAETLETKSQIKSKEEKIAWLKEKEKDIPFLKAKMAEVEQAYNDNDSTSIRDKLTAYISDFAENNNCLVTEIPLSSEYKNAHLSVETNIFTVRGPFKELLKLEYELEGKFKLIAKIMSARFFSVKDMQTKRKNLYLTIVTQSFNEVNKTK
jgi:hypothetical protein